VADEVSASLCSQLLDALEGRGLSRSELLQGLSLSEEDLKRPRGRISWTVFVAILDRAAERLGGPEALEEVGAEHARRPVFRWFPAVARAAMSPRDLYWLGRWYGQSVFRNVSCWNQPVGRIGVHQQLEIQAADADCPAFFHLMRGALRTIPCFLGLREARVDMALTPRRALFTITPPASRSMLARVFQKLRFSGAAVREMVDELAQQHEELLETYRELNAAYEDLQAQAERRRQMESELQQAQRLEAVGRLASGIAHDFNNVLTTVIVCSDSAFEHIDDPDALREDLDRIREAATRAAGVTGKLLAFGRSQPTRPVVLDLNETIEKLEDVLRRLIGSSILLETRLDPSLGSVRIDPTQLDQILLNLVLNARDAVGESGWISVTTTGVTALRDDAQVPGLKAGAYACLSVGDTGCGMDTETQERVFDPFFTTKPVGSGTGLGLSIVHGIVSQSGGKVTVSSEAGVGTTVFVYLPVSTESETVAPALPRHLGSGQTGGTVLLAEDDEELRSVVHRILKSAGYHVVEAIDGAQASRIVTDADQAIDVLVTDIRMPGANGWDVANVLRGRDPSLPVLYLSGYPEDGAWRQLTANEAFLNKPFTAEELCDHIRALMA